MDKKILAQLEKIIGRDGVLTSPEDLAVYSYDGTFEEAARTWWCCRAPRTRSARWLAGRAGTHTGGIRAGWGQDWQAARCLPGRHRAGT